MIIISCDHAGYDFAQKLMAYFDNAATTFPKPDCVYDFMDKFYREHGGNAGRGNHEFSLTAGKLISDTRGRLQEILHCQNKQIIFTPTATIALNMIFQGENLLQ